MVNISDTVLHREERVATLGIHRHRPMNQIHYADVSDLVSRTIGSGRTINVVCTQSSESFVETFLHARVEGGPDLAGDLRQNSVHLKHTGM
jgi:hypothetical protein